MANIDYNNPNSINPGVDFKPSGLLGGLLYAQDRSRYENQASLSDLMNVNKMREYYQDTPVRDSKRFADTQTNLGIGETIRDQKVADLRGKQLENSYNQGTLSARMGKTIVDAKDKEMDFNLKKLQQGMQLSAMMAQASNSYGPAGAAAIASKLREQGIDVSNDPVVNYVMSGADATQVQQRVHEVQNAFNMANQEYRTRRMQEGYATMRSLLDANARVDTAGAKTPAEREHDLRWQAYKKRIKMQNPNMSDAQVEAEAVVMMDAAKYGVQKPEDRLTTSLSSTIAELEQIVGFLDPNQPMTQRLKRQIEALKAQRTSATGATPGRGAGTAADPIKLD